MIERFGDVFADAAFWIALVANTDRHHDRAQQLSDLINGKIFTTSAVLLESANTLSRPTWRPHMCRLVEHIQSSQDFNVQFVSTELWSRGWELFRSRPDKSWSLTDCISFIVMGDLGLVNALTSDQHFRQAGFRPLMSEEA